jgi:hypothetical protein
MTFLTIVSRILNWLANQRGKKALIASLCMFFVIKSSQVLYPKDFFDSLALNLLGYDLLMIIMIFWP